MTDEINPKNIKPALSHYEKSAMIGKKLGLLDGKELILRIFSNEITIPEALNKIDLLLKEADQNKEGYQTK